MDLWRIAIRVLITYVVVHQLVRHAGKRAVGDAQSGRARNAGIAIILTIILGDMVDDAMWGEVPMAQFVVGAGSLVLVHILTELARYASPVIWRLMDGTPLTVMTDGRADTAELRHEQIRGDDFAALLRHGGIGETRRAEVRRAVLENTGRLSVLPSPGSEPATKADRDALDHLAR